MQPRYSGNSLMRRCGGCRTRHYCSVPCQRSDWTEGNHRYECRILGRLAPRIPQPFILVLLRAFLCLVAKEESANQKTMIFDHLAASSQNIDDDDQIYLTRSIQMACELIQADWKEIGSRLQSVADARRLYNLASAIRCNAFAVTDYDLSTTGTCLYVNHLNRLNHSCRANSMIVFDGRLGRVVAQQDIATDEEITISYYDPLMARWERRKSLWEQFRFHCDCSRCSSAAVATVDDDIPLAAFKCPNPGCKGQWAVGGEMLASVFASDTSTTASTSGNEGKNLDPFNLECSTCRSVVLDCRQTISRAAKCRERRKQLEIRQVSLGGCGGDDKCSDSKSLTDFLVQSTRLYDEQRSFMPGGNAEMLSTAAVHQVNLIMVQLWPEALQVAERLLSDYQAVLAACQLGGTNLRLLMQQLIVYRIKMQMEPPIAAVDPAEMAKTLRQLETLYSSGSPFCRSLNIDFNAMLMSSMQHRGR